MKFSAIVIAAIGLVVHTAAYPAQNIERLIGRSVQSIEASNEVTSEDPGEMKADYRRGVDSVVTEGDPGEMKADYRRRDDSVVTEGDPEDMRADYRRRATLVVLQK